MTSASCCVAYIPQPQPAQPHLSRQKSNISVSVSAQEDITFDRTFDLTKMENAICVVTVFVLLEQGDQNAVRHP